MAKSFSSVLSKTKVELEPLYITSDSSTSGVAGNVPYFRNSFAKDSGDNIPSIRGEKNNFNATTFPSLSDDSDSGYSVGSDWIYNNEAFTLTDDSPGNANWEKIDSGLFNYKCWVSPNGDDNTAQLGDKNQPFATVQAAVDTIVNHPDYRIQKFLIIVTPGYYIQNFWISEDTFIFFEKGAELEVNPPDSSETGISYGRYSKEDFRGGNRGILGYARIYNNTSFTTISLYARNRRGIFEAEYIEIIGNSDAGANSNRIIGFRNSSFINIGHINFKNTDNRFHLTGNFIKIDLLENNINQNIQTFLTIREGGATYENGTNLHIKKYIKNSNSADRMNAIGFHYCQIDNVISTVGAGNGTLRPLIFISNLITKIGYVYSEGNERGIEYRDSSGNDYFNQKASSGQLITIDYMNTVNDNINTNDIQDSHTYIKADTLISGSRNFFLRSAMHNEPKDRNFVNIKVNRAISNSNDANIRFGASNALGHLFTLNLEGDFINNNSTDSYNIHLPQGAPRWQKNGGGALNGNYRLKTLVLYDSSTAGTSGVAEYENLLDTYYYICRQKTGSGTNAPTGLKSDNTWWEWLTTSRYEINFKGETKLITNPNASNSKGWALIKSPVNFRSLGNVYVNHKAFFNNSEGKLQNWLSNNHPIFVEPKIIS